MTEKIYTKESLDIKELSGYLNKLEKGQISPAIFHNYRLARGIYGQRQKGSQMVRVKIPAGKLNTDQLIRLADVAENYTNGNLHITTRQSIQYHFVKLKDTPLLWDDIATVGLTLKEACGNTVRNITASATAGIDRDEVFDVTPYVFTVYNYFLRNPICQDLGRKVKLAFSSSLYDSAFTYFGDIGFIPKENERSEKGFKVVLGGGLGAQPRLADTVFEFLEDYKVIPFIEAAIRVFERYGERKNRNKARLKFLIKEIGVEEFLRLVEQEKIANKFIDYSFDFVEDSKPLQPKIIKENPIDENLFKLWVKHNVSEQKQKGFYSAEIKIKLGNISSDKARALAKIVDLFAENDIRLTINQSILLRFIKQENLPVVFNQLYKIGLAEYGSNSIADITACPGTDTCNLGITNSTNLAEKLEEVIYSQYAELIDEEFLKIKISGCMNSCGQHMAANIGFHGSSLNVNGKVIPAMQLVLGGGVDANGRGSIAQKIKKIPTKKVPNVLRVLLNDFKENRLENEPFNNYFHRLGEKYFTTLVDPLATKDNLDKDDFYDWGSEKDYIKSVGKPKLEISNSDLVSLFINKANSHLSNAQNLLSGNDFADSIFYSYSAIINSAKALLLRNSIECRTNALILSKIEEVYPEKFDGFSKKVTEFNSKRPEKPFAEKYFEYASDTVNKLKKILKENK